MTHSLSDHGASELDVFLRGTRTYVQGTQLVARAAEMADAGHGATVTRAAFNAITDHRVAAGVSAEPVPGLKHLGHVAFSGTGGQTLVQLYELDGQAPRSDADMGISIALEGIASPLNGTYAYSGAANLEGALNVLVQCVKALHEKIAPSVRDVWFTGLRNFPLPLDWPADGQSGRLSTERMRVMRSGSQYQSLVKVTIASAAGREIVSGVINFAFKSDEDLDVA